MEYGASGGHDLGNRETRQFNLLYVLNASLIVEWHWRSFVYLLMKFN